MANAMHFTRVPSGDWGSVHAGHIAVGFDIDGADTASVGSTVTVRIDGSDDAWTATVTEVVTDAKGVVVDIRARA